MGWLGNLFGNNSKEASEYLKMEDASNEIGGLNFKTALEAHIAWKQKLKGIIDGTGTEVLDPTKVSRDDQCPLGKWIYSEGQQKFGGMAGFQELVSSHAHFHKCAGHTLELALDGKYQEAEKEMTGSGSFSKASLNVSRHLLKLWKELGIDQ